MNRARTGFGRRLATLTAMTLAALVISACTWFASVGEPKVEVEGGDPTLGKNLIMDHGCIACHSIPGIDGADAHVGPPLDAWVDRRYIAGLLPNEPDNLVAWIMNPQRFEPGTAMPTLGVNEDEARHIAAYLYTLDD